MANKIFVTGDTHGRFQKLISGAFSKRHDLDKDDYVIICGDFGGIWDRLSEEEQGVGESRNEMQILDRLECLPFTTLFVDGNHEAFDRLNSYKVEEWHGGKVHKIRPSIIHLMRGQVFEIAGKRIFTFGGARSHDISDGILDYDDPEWRAKARYLQDRGKNMFRVKGFSWWEEELPSEEEMENGIRNLAKYNNEVDYILSHSCAGQLLKAIDEKMEEDSSLTRYFDAIRMNCNYKKWYFGHYHRDKNVTEKDIVLYHQIVELGEQVNENMPILGKPKYALFQPVKFDYATKQGVVEELIGVIAIRDTYGTFSNPEEPSYDIVALLDEEICLFKHRPESAVKELTDEEIKENMELIVELKAKCGKR